MALKSTAALCDQGLQVLDTRKNPFGNASLKEAIDEKSTRLDNISPRDDIFALYMETRRWAGSTAQTLAPMLDYDTFIALCWLFEKTKVLAEKYSFAEVW